MQPPAKEYWQLDQKLKVARNEFSCRASGWSVTLPILKFQPSNTEFGLLASRYVRQEISVVLGYHIYRDFVARAKGNEYSFFGD